MDRRGRKPLATAHVQRLEGSQRAKLRLETILETIRGTLPVPEACARLGVCESRFHALRKRWLQQSLELLEPRPMGRPPKESSPASDPENDRLRRELQLATAQKEIAEIMATTGSTGSLKKKRRSRRARSLRAK